MKTRLLRAALFTPGPRNIWGLPLLLWGLPGVAKSAILRGPWPPRPVLRVDLAAPRGCGPIRASVANCLRRGGPRAPCGRPRDRVPGRLLGLRLPRRPRAPRRRPSTGQSPLAACGGGDGCGAEERPRGLEGPSVGRRGRGGDEAGEDFRAALATKRLGGISALRDLVEGKEK